MIGGDERIVEAHDRAVRTTVGWVEKNAVPTGMKDGTTGAMVYAGDQKMVAATFRHDTPPAACGAGREREATRRVETGKPPRNSPFEESRDHLGGFGPP